MTEKETRQPSPSGGGAFGGLIIGAVLGALLGGGSGAVVGGLIGAIIGDQIERKAQAKKYEGNSFSWHLLKKLGDVVKAIRALK